MEAASDAIKHAILRVDRETNRGANLIFCEQKITCDGPTRR